MNRNKIFTCLCGVLAATALSFQVQAASVTVNTTNDVSAADSECSLREAIQSVNTNTATGGCSSTGAGVIDTVELPAGTYNLTLIGIDDDNTAGDLDVLANLTLNGAGTGTTAISAQGLEDNGGPERVLHINPLGVILNVTLNGVTVRDGLEDGDGGGILIEGNQAPVAAAKLGIFDGTFTLVTLNEVDVVENTSNDDTGGILSTNTMLILENCSVSDNVSLEDGGGISSFSSDLETRIANSVIDGNTAGFGGGIVGGGLTGGGLTIDSSTISNNTACSGGGILAEGEVLLINSTVSGNGADGDCQVATGTADSNLGGGIALVSDSSLEVVNSTISGNFAPVAGGGILLAVFPTTSMIKLGTVANPGVRLFNATIAENESDETGGGVAAIVIQPLGATAAFFSASNTIIADNSAPSGPDCSADFTSLGYNLIGDVNGCNGFTGTGDQTGVDPQLGPLQDNGGPTFTQALLVGSPAIDTADPNGCLDQAGAVLNRDQRGETRPVNATGLATAICDIGAFEFQIPEPTPTPTPTATPGFLLNGTGCAMAEGAAPSAAPLLVLLAGLGALVYRRQRRAE